MPLRRAVLAVHAGEDRDEDVEIPVVFEILPDQSS
jgi:hypothetical protein